MAIFKCKMCGGQLEITEGTTVCTCDYCGTEQTLPRLDSDKKANLYDRANHFRRNNDFDKAMSVYEQILNEDNTDAEAYWSLVICKYGIEYVEEPVTNKRIPTVNRAQFTSVFDDENYKQALANADAAQKAVYENEAKTINEIQKGILAISSKEEPFDVFICYKESDENGSRTPDSVLANDLYHQLTQEGFKVFFARITLEDKLGQEYEPYIFAALNSAKVMVVLGTKPEYYKAVWVKNEWSRYLALIRQGEKKMLIPAYKDMDPYDLPEEFSHLQAQDMTKLGFMQDLIRGIKKIIGSDQTQTATKETVAVQQGGGTGNTNALIKRGNIALEDGEWQKADDFFEEVLNQHAECAEAYLGKLMSKYKKSNIPSLTQYFISKYESTETEKLEACPEASLRIENAVSQYMVPDYLSDAEIRNQYVFDRTYISKLSFRKMQKRKEMDEIAGERLLQRAKKYATGETKSLIDKMLEDISSALDRRILDAEQVDNKQIAFVKSSYEMHLNAADTKVQELYNKALERQEGTYNSRVSQMNAAKSIFDYEEARDLLRGMNGYKDTMALAEKCQMEIDRLIEEEKLEAERQEAARKKAVKKWVKVFVIASAVFVVLNFASFVFFLYVCAVVIPKSNYNNAVALMNSGNYEEAIERFRMCEGYKDSDDLVFSAEVNIMKEASVGDDVIFGDYNGNNEWTVLAKEEGRMLVISKCVIEDRPYHEEYTTVTWESCDLRSWLNETYLMSAFSNSEQEMIISTNIVNSDNPEWGTDGGNDTTDKVFLLSTDEVNNYFSTDEERKAALSDGTEDSWWLRSPGDDNDKYAACVYGDGSVDADGFFVDNEHVGIRPALWINIDPQS